MRTWIEHIISQPAICSDFVAWTKSAELNLNKKMAEYIRENEIEKARGAAYEMEVYRSLRSTIKKEMNERIAQIAYAESNNQ